MSTVTPGDVVGGICLGVVFGVGVALFFTAETAIDKDARRACTKAGYHGGVYRADSGFICFNYVSEPLKVTP